MSRPTPSSTHSPQADIAIIGGGILGTSMSYFLAHLNPGKKVVVVEKEADVARHASGRNTGKVHAPYLYNPDRRRVAAKAAYAGFDMWKMYAGMHGLPFEEDGVIEVSPDADGHKTLEKYMRWAKANGLSEEDVELVDGAELKRREPEIHCHSAIICSRDGSVDYGMMTQALRKDAEAAGVRFVTNSKVAKVTKRDGQTVLSVSTGADRPGPDVQTGGREICAGFVINAAGGGAVDIAHKLGVAQEYTDLYFRGEYWKAPPQYAGLTSASVYSVPTHAGYPFLDPHWILRAGGGGCEVGPNAVPVFSPYGYNITDNVLAFVPKAIEMLCSGARRTVMDPTFRELVAGEIASSISKTAMINRIRRFPPRIEPRMFTRRGLAGIRAQVVDADGRFVPDVMIEHGEGSLSILNYNSPGATGALPFCAGIIARLHRDGVLRHDPDADQCGPWKFSEISGFVG